jgi:hypothetical protein
MDAYRIDSIPDELSSFDLFHISGGGDKSRGQVLHRQLADAAPYSKSFYPIGPEELIPEKWLDNSWDSGCTVEGRGNHVSLSYHKIEPKKVKVGLYFGDLPLRLAPVVPAPPW